MKIRLLVILSLSLITVQTGISAEFNGKVLLKINGHGYLLDDVFGKYLIQEWDANSESISADFPLSDSWELHLGKIKKLKYKTVNGNPDRVKLYITIDKSEFCLFPGVGHLCGYLTKAFVLRGYR